VDKLVVDQLHNASLLIEEGKAQASSGFLLIGSALSLVLREKLWVNSHKDFGEYCTSVNISRSYAYKLAKIWDRFGEKARQIEPSRLLKLLPLELEDEGEILEQARELNPGAWRDRLRELGGETPTDDCDHATLVSVCSKCSKRFV
jgi:hypothetical protein